MHDIVRFYGVMDIVILLKGPDTPMMYEEGLSDDHRRVVAELFCLSRL